MAITHPVAIRNQLADLVVDAIDGGTTNPTGKLVLKDGATVLAELNMFNPAFGAASGGTATANAITDDTSANASGTADNFEIQNRDGTVILTGNNITTTGGGGDLELNALFVAIGVNVSVTSLTYSAPA
jgi:hypothetical protein